MPVCNWQGEEGGILGKDCPGILDHVMRTWFCFICLGNFCLYSFF